MKKLLLILPILCVLAFPILAEELEQSWQTYLNTNAQLALLQERQSVLKQSHVELNREIDRLQSRFTWYNAWYTKWQLSDLNARNLILADTLGSLSAQALSLDRQLQQDQQDLERQYAARLRNVEDGSSLSGVEQRTILEVGQWYQGRSKTQVEFPNYAQLLEAEYTSTTIRGWVLKDLVIIIEGKLLALDSLIREQQESEELNRRLMAFHEDLGMILEGDEPVASDGNRAPASPSLSWNDNRYVDASNEMMDGSGGGSERTASDKLMTSADLTASRRVDLAVSPGSDMEIDHEDLQHRRLEYQRLLDQLRRELESSP